MNASMSAPDPPLCDLQYTRIGVRRSLASDELRFDAEFMKQELRIAVEEFGDPTAADQIYLSLWCLRIVVGIERCVNDARRRTGNLPPLPVDDPGIVRLAKKYIRKGCERIDV